MKTGMIVICYSLPYLWFWRRKTGVSDRELAFVICWSIAVVVFGIVSRILNAENGFMLPVLILQTFLSFGSIFLVRGQSLDEGDPEKTKD
jgi:hypothetical protein